MTGSSRYTEAGVDIEAGDQIKARIGQLIRGTYSPSVLHRDGAFGGLFSLAHLSMQKPVLVSSVDGVGTKVKVASTVGKHKGIGVDLVNHCIDDILVCGAQPLFFLDYFACHTLNQPILAELVEGMAEACQEAGMSLLGGETAQMTDVYRTGEYDLAGTIVGVVDEDQIIDGSAIKPGDVLFGLPSSGLHTNGYTLARKVLLEDAQMDLAETATGLNQPLGDALLEPHRSYLEEINALREAVPVKGMAHITGGGFVGNVGRILPQNCQAVIDVSLWTTPALFTLIQSHGGVSNEEMYRVFNMGIGMVAVIGADQLTEAQRILPEGKPIGQIQAGEGVQLTGLK